MEKSKEYEYIVKKMNNKKNIKKKKKSTSVPPFFSLDISSLNLDEELNYNVFKYKICLH